MKTLGIDLGNWSCHVAYSDDIWMPKFVTEFKSPISQIKCLLGRKFSDPELEDVAQGCALQAIRVHEITGTDTMTYDLGSSRSGNFRISFKNIKFRRKKVEESSEKFLWRRTMHEKGHLLTFLNDFLEKNMHRIGRSKKTKTESYWLSKANYNFDEIEILRKLRHTNLVQLIGACAENRAVIYEYIPNGSLEDRLRCKNDSPPLSWQARTRIAHEICSALSFLHCSKPHGIVHGDLKPDNILLNLSNVSKISDFGLCRELNTTDSASVPFHSTDIPKGTIGYMDPEYFSTAKITPQSDVYSFGIILLRLVTCKEPSGIGNLVEEAQQKGTLKALIDASAGPWPFKLAKKMMLLGLRCSDPMRKNRPDLSIRSVERDEVHATSC